MGLTTIQKRKNGKKLTFEAQSSSNEDGMSTLEISRDLLFIEMIVKKLCYEILKPVWCCVATAAYCSLLEITTRFSTSLVCYP